ncbi:MAG: Uma2 family endonuclease [Clostridiales bacterium]|nr:Uma2 family endonuclease [Clostridiales bacterium]
MPLPKEQLYTVEDIYKLPDGQRAELIDGVIYNMAPPGTLHQVITGELYATIRDFIKKNNGQCKPYISPFAVFLSDKSNDYLEPDISIICSPDKIDERGCHGAPDWVIEVVSPGTQTRDYGIKLFKYRMLGVREYWIVNPVKKVVNVYDFEKDKATNIYAFDEPIPVAIYPGFTIKLSDLLI